MKRFVGIPTIYSLTKEDYEKLLTLPAEEIDEWSPVKVVILKDQQELYYTFARSIADKIKENNKKNLPSTFMLPVLGQMPQYRMLSDITNRERISWKNVWTFNLDDYLDWEGRQLPINHPMSFKGITYRNLFNLIDSELRIPESQIFFPDPFNPDEIEKKIVEIGGIDTLYDGIGYHGYIAFNEPVDTYFVRLTPEEFMNSKTRIVDFRPDSFVVDSILGLYGNCYGLPPRAITVGMRSILKARTIELYCDGSDFPWQSTAFRLACMHPPSLDRPITYIQKHPNPKETVTIFVDSKTASPIILDE
jgi:glucosamine-6-phosphate deaminase